MVEEVKAEQEDNKAVEPTRDFEKEAREMGWVAEEEFHGGKDKWKPAEQYVKDGENILPIVRANEKRLREELKQKDAEFEQRIMRMEKMNTEAQARAKESYDRDIARIKAEQLAAVDAGDTEEYKRLESEKDTLKAPAETSGDDLEAIQKGWIAKNQWYEDDDMMAFSAERFSQKLVAENPNLSLAENLEKTEAHIKGKYPEKFGGSKPKQNGQAAVDSGGDFPGRTSKKTAAANLPPEARAQAKADIEAGLYKNEEAWAKAYFGT